MNSEEEARARATHKVIMSTMLTMQVGCVIYLGLGRIIWAVELDRLESWLTFALSAGCAIAMSTLSRRETPSIAAKELRITPGWCMSRRCIRIRWIVSWSTRYEEAVGDTEDVLLPRTARGVPVYRTSVNMEDVAEPRQTRFFIFSIILFVCVRIVILVGAVETLRSVGGLIGNWRLFCLVAAAYFYYMYLSRDQDLPPVAEEIRASFRPYLPYAGLRAGVSVAREAAQEGVLAGQLSSNGDGGQTVAVEEVAAVA